MLNNLQRGLAASELIDDDTAGEELAFPEVGLHRELLLLLEVARDLGRVLPDVRRKSSLVLRSEDISGLR